ncbi:MAG TPA: histidine phosphatase family protein [Mycobacteriales bacterium]|nr:histidine phosphatase family protein [Mycobacteriales bacterium]
MEGLPGHSPARCGADRPGDGGGVLSARKIVFWRHGQTIWNLEHRFQGRTDIPLDETGRTQAKTAARLLAGMRPDAIVSSDLMRARDTAGELAAITGLPVATDPRLQERSGGEWEGLTGEEIRSRYPAEWAIWEPVGGEAETDLGERVAAAVTDALSTLPDEQTLVVASHGGAIRAGLAVLLGLPPAVWGRLGPLSNCSWSVVGEAPAGWRATGWRLLEHNAGTLPEPVLSDDR